MGLQQPFKLSETVALVLGNSYKFEKNRSLSDGHGKVKERGDRSAMLSLKYFYIYAKNTYM